jgi:phospholipase C
MPGAATHGEVGVGMNADGRLEVFIINDPGNCWHNWQTTAGGTWAGWHELATGLAGNPTVCANKDGRLEVFARGADASIRHAWQVSPGGAWSQWATLAGGTHNDIAAAMNADGRLEVFIINDPGNCWHNWQTTAGGTTWAGWHELGTGLARNPTVCANKDGRLEMFARGADNVFRDAWQVTPGGGWSGPWAIGRIRHVFVVMLENRSFDHVFGYSGIIGIDAQTGALTAVEGLAQPRSNVNPAAAPPQTIMTSPTAGYTMGTDVEHEFLDVLCQLCGPSRVPATGVLTNGQYPPIDNSGFVANYVAKFSTGDPSTPMRCFAPGSLPVLEGMARNFAVCDHWFASHPGPTFPNHFFMHAAAATGQADSPTDFAWAATLDPFTFPNGMIFDRVVSAGLSYHVYYGCDCYGLRTMKSSDWPPSIYLLGVAGATQMGSFAAHVNNPGFTTNYIFIEPDGGNQGYSAICQSNGENDMHPPSDVRAGEQLIQQVYQAIRNSPHWEESLFVVVFDEHGGFYDHVPPPPAAAPGDGEVDNTHNFQFNQLGVRVPALICSPWIPFGVIDHTVYNHASVLATVERLFGLAPLTDRDANSNDFMHLFSLPAPRQDAPTVLTALPSETLIRVPETGEVYVIAGGAPIYVTNWNDLGGPKPPLDLDIAMFRQLPHYPAGGTYITGLPRSETYVVAGGAPIYVTSWANVGGSKPNVNVDIGAIDAAGTAGSTALSHLNYRPADGTYITGLPRSETYVVAGGAPIYVTSWANVGGSKPNVNVDIGAIDAAGTAGSTALSHLNYRPADGTYICGFLSQKVYRVAGGAALYIDDWAPLGGPQPFVEVDQAAIDGAGATGSTALSHLRSLPADGTLLRGLPSGEYWVVTGGRRSSASAGANAVDVTDDAISRIPQ